MPLISGTELAKFLFFFTTHLSTGQASWRQERPREKLPAPGPTRRHTVTVDIASLLKAPDSNESLVTPTQHSRSASLPSTVATTAPTVAVGPPLYAAPRIDLGPGPLHHPLGKRTMPPHASESPAKKQSKWSPEEDSLIIELRGNGMKWEDISKRLPGRSAISCRLHYQNYLERRSEWDEERKNKLARLYERFKPEMWAKVAEEMAIPWRAAEAMHWQLGEQDMARRAGVVPFALSAVTLENTQPRGHARGHSHSHSQGSLPRDVMATPRAYGRAGPSVPPPPPPSSSLAGRGGLAARKDPSAVPPPPPPPLPPQHAAMHAHAHTHAHPESHQQQQHGQGAYEYTPQGGPLAPIQAQGHSRPPGMLPGLAELTTGVSPYSTPAYSIGIPSVSPAQSATASPGPFVHTLGYPPLEPVGSKRRRSPDNASPEASRRRHHLDHPRPDYYERAMPRHMP